MSGAAPRGGVALDAEESKRYVWMTTEGEGLAVGGAASTLPRLATTKRFYPDDVFAPHESQADVYARAVQPLVMAVPTGVSASVLAYGQTGSGGWAHAAAPRRDEPSVQRQHRTRIPPPHSAGKTYTMVGEPSNPATLGVVPRACDDLFSKLRAMTADEGWVWIVKVRTAS